MKKVLLFLTAFFSLASIAQTITSGNSLVAGNSQLYWTADSSASNLNSTIGAGAIWDYSNLTGYAGATNLDTIKNASDSPDYGNFSSADFHDDLSGGASSYFQNFPDSVVSYGFVFTVNGNTVKVMHDIDPMKALELPMSLNDSFTDSTYGSADVYGSNAATAGDVVVIADGTGTLNLGSSTFTNVIRIKTVETIETTVVLPPPFNTVTGTVSRTVYNYYDLVNQNMPIFIHANIFVASNLFNGGYSAVYSSVELTSAGLNSESSALKLGIYPNPAHSIVTITSDKADQLIIIDALGRVVVSMLNPQATETFDLNNFEAGMYLVQIIKGESTQTEKLIVE